MIFAAEMVLQPTERYQKCGHRDYSGALMHVIALCKRKSWIRASESVGLINQYVQ